MDKNKKELLKCIFKSAIEYNLYVYVVVKINDKEELIINKPKNVGDKLNYYLGAYNDNLELKTNTNISITDFGARTKNDLIDIINSY